MTKPTKKEEILRDTANKIWNAGRGLSHNDIDEILSDCSDRLLAADRKEVAREVEKLARPTPHALLMMKEVRAADLEQKGKSQVDCDAGYNTAIVKVLSLLRPQSSNQE